MMTATTPMPQSTKHDDGGGGNDASVHPMIPVPTAIRIVLQETARRMLSSTAPTNNNSMESLPVNDPSALLGRVVATPGVYVQTPGYPPYRASILDGYAVVQSKSSSSSGGVHRVRDRVHAGDSTTTIPITRNDDTTDPPYAYYVTTGARVPDECDCVVAVEDTTVIEQKDVTNNNNEQWIHIPPAAVAQNSSKTWIRDVGCDLPAGSVVMEAGTVVDAVGYGLLQQAGVSTVKVRPQVRVGILSTGNELRDGNSSWTLEEGRRNGTIPDVNRLVLLALLSECYGNAVATVDLGVVRDDDDQVIAERLQNHTELCDVIITTGGISMGDADRMEHVLTKLLGGTLHFGRLHMKPGKPTTFLTLPKTLVFALPGNPVSAVVCTHLLVRPCIEFLMQGLDTSTADTHGANVEEYLERAVANARVAYMEQSVVLRETFRLDPERPEYHRIDGQGYSTGVQRSSRLASLRDAHELVVLPQATADYSRTNPTDRLLVLQMNDRRRLRVKESQHLTTSTTKTKTSTKPPLRIAVVVAEKLDGLLLPSTSVVQEKDLVTHMETSLYGSKSGHAHVTSVTVSNNPVLPNDKKEDIDLIVVVGPPSLVAHAQWVQDYQSRLVQPAAALALQMQQGAAAVDATAPLFASVAGTVLCNEQRRVVVVLIPRRGWAAALSHVRGLLKHAVRTTRGGS